MTSTTRAELSDAAALIVAQTTDNTDAVTALLTELGTTNDARPILRLLHCTIVAAGLAADTEAEAAADRGDRHAPGLEYLVRLAAHAHQHSDPEGGQDHREG